MRDLELGRLVRAIRRRRGLRQSDCARLSGVHRSTWSSLERGQLGRMTVETLRRCLAALEIRLDLRPQWRGAELDRMLDSTHASVQAAWASLLRSLGWQVWIERSFSHYGERGRIDLFCWHEGTRIALIIEVKTELADAQALLGGLDVKTRLADSIARGLGLGQPATSIPMILFTESMTTRRRVAALSSLFTQFDMRGKAAIHWLRDPRSPVAGLMIFTTVGTRRVRGVGTHRVRPAKGSLSTRR